MNNNYIFLYFLAFALFAIALYYLFIEKPQEREHELKLAEMDLEKETMKNEQFKAHENPPKTNPIGFKKNDEE